MKTHYSFIKGCCLLAAFLLAIPLTGLATTSSRLFKPRHQTSLVRSLNAQLTHSDTIPLQNMSAVYAFSIDATITQPREASFVRIVLEDAEGHDYLVAESDRFRNDTSNVQLTEYCEETARLDGITPVRLKCYLAGDATLTVTGIHTSDQAPTRGEATSMETAAAIKEAQVQDIVDRINNYNVRHGKLWRAGLNSWALADYDSDIKGEGDAYTANFKYYTDGIYEMGERPAQRTTYVSPYVEAFDWRNRHGECWIDTLIRDQGNTKYCTAFATTGMMEALVNLYFNKHINLDLSEQDIINYSAPLYAYSPNIVDAVSHVVSDSLIDDFSWPFTGNDTTTMPRPYGIERVSMFLYHPVLTSSYNSLGMDSFFDEIKKNLINNGPGIMGYIYTVPETYYYPPIWEHYMMLVGYGTVTQNDINSLVITSSTSNQTLPVSNNALGLTYWIFKDSYGNISQTQYQHNGFRYVIFYDYSKLENAYFAWPPIYRRGHTDSEIKCTDNDNDGYFNWGIGERPDFLLPPWAEEEEDADDSNDSIGAFSDSYGHSSPVDYFTYEGTFDGTGSAIVDSSWFHRSYFYLESNATVTFKGTIVFHPSTSVEMFTGSTIILDGGTFVNPTFIVQQNCSLILNNGAKIIYTRHNPNFSLPLGMKLIINEGEIKYVRDYY